MEKEINQEKRAKKDQSKKKKRKRKKRRRKIGKSGGKEEEVEKDGEVTTYELTRAATCVNLRAHAHL